MSWTLQDVQNSIAVELDGNASISPTSTNWYIRNNVINRVLVDWSSTYDWKELLKIHNGVVSTSTGNASYVLPTDLMKLDGFPRIGYDGTQARDFTVVDPSTSYHYSDSDLYVNVLGNPGMGGRVMYIHAGTIASGASVQFTYFASPASLVSPADVSEIPDPTYLVQRSLYYLYKRAEDPRQLDAKAESDKILARMIENENTLGQAYYDRQVRNVLTDKYSFRVGRD